jgi:hypothetical protein
MDDLDDGLRVTFRSDVFITRFLLLDFLVATFVASHTNSLRFVKQLLRSLLHHELIRVTSRTAFDVVQLSPTEVLE